MGDLVCFSEAFQTGREVRACGIGQECNGDVFTLGGERGSRLAPGWICDGSSAASYHGRPSMWAAFAATSHTFSGTTYGLR
jgi:hypothetical protein